MRAEWDAVKLHAAYTETILGRITPFRELAAIAGAHHERLDGTGYPRGLSGADIRIETRIITTADIFDAITAARPYRGAIPMLAFTPVPVVRAQLALSWGIETVLGEPAEHTDEMTRLFPKVRRLTVKGAGHWVHSEQPEVFVQILDRFLDG